MKLIIILSSLIFTVNCGLLDSLQDNKEESKKPDLLKKIATDLKDDGKIFVDAITASFKKKTQDKKEVPSKDEKDPEVAESTPKSPEDTKPKPEDAEGTLTTPKSPEVTPGDKPEASTTKTEEVSSAKTEDAAPKPDAKEASPKTE